MLVSTCSVSDEMCVVGTYVNMTELGQISSRHITILEALVSLPSWSASRVLRTVVQNSGLIIAVLLALPAIMASAKPSCVSVSWMQGRCPKVTRIAVSWTRSLMQQAPGA
jgi:hypothetical protein